MCPVDYIQSFGGADDVAPTNNLSLLVVIWYIVGMYYYEVLAGDAQFHGNGALTYSWDGVLMPGSVVRVALRNRPILGIVHQQVTAPSFAVKPIQAVAPYPPLPVASIALLSWLQSYYPAPYGVTVRQFLPPSTVFPRKRNMPDLGSETVSDKERSSVVPKTTPLPPLTSEQNEAIKKIADPGIYLLHGITGSGKSRVYVELAANSLAHGSSAIILTPEIGLTEHLVQQFKSLGSPIYVLHSRLTGAERRDIWYEILGRAEPCIIIGPRSALFAPVKKIGLIVMDEAHDQAYKSDSSPYYRTDRVAAYLAQAHKAYFVTGTATPNIEDMYIAHAKKRTVVIMSTLAKQEATMQTTKLMVDMRDQSQRTKSQILSTPLITAIETALDHTEQTLLFLNRRGTAAAILCNACGWRAACHYCDLPLTYHGDTHTLRCHVCGRVSVPPTVCPECKNGEIVFRSIGTKAVVEEVHKLFPAARVKRFDTDTNKAEQIEQQLAALQSGECDILVGTQMITKGLDLPKLSVVGVLNADSGLLVPDFTATERSFQQISQVVGRVGRGHRHSTVVIQTYNPDSPTLTDALQQNWSAFYERELTERKLYRYPPFVYLLKLWCLRASSKSAEAASTELADFIRQQHIRLTIEGPSPAFHPRESGKYKWQLILKSSSRQALLDIVAKLPSGWHHDIDPIDLL